MEQNTENLKITYAKNLNKVNFTATVSTPIDANVNIKNILDVNAYLFNTKTECGNGKCILTGKLGVKVLYIDTDNITNTLTDTISFSENITDASITSNCFIVASESNITNNILSTEGNLKINFDISLNPILYVNLPLNTSSNFDNMIVKKSKIETNSICQQINTGFEYTVNFETKDTISKILYFNCYYNNINLTCFENYCVAEGKLYSTLVYETQENEETIVKQLTDTFNVKTDIDMQGINSDCLLDVFFDVDKSKENLTTEVEQDNNIVTITNHIKVAGVCSKNITLDIVDDMYSTENEVELNLKTREFVNNITNNLLEFNANGEISLSTDETAIDNVIGNLEIVAEITNKYIKDNHLYVEGVISSMLTYIDENKDYKSKQCDIPFVVNTKIELNSIYCVKTNLSVEDCKVKIKRGTIIELEYAMVLNTCVYSQTSKQIVDNFKVGKNLDFSNFDYQIYLAKPNESMWELCKRIKTTPDNLIKFNKNLPSELMGSEKIIVKR